MDKPVAAAPTGAKEKVEKQARQLAYDVRYKTKQSMAQKSGGRLDPAQVQKAYMSQLAKSPAPPAVKSRAKQMLMGEDYKAGIDKLVSDSAASALFKVFVEHHQKDKDGNTIPHEVEEINEEEKQYKVRVTDKKTNNSYVRMATRAKISELRANPNISSVEMTEYGTPTKSEKLKGKQTAKVKQGLDPVGKEDSDVNNDGKVNSSDKYLMKRRKAIGKAMAKEEYSWRDGFAELIEKKEKEKKITGEGVDNSKLIKVFPDEVKEQMMDKEEKPEMAKPDPQLVSKEKKQAMLKKQVLMKKLQAVRAGAGSDITSSYEPEGETIEEGDYKLTAAQIADARRTENRIAARERAAAKRRKDRNQLRKQGQFGASGKYYVTKNMEKESVELEGENVEEKATYGGERVYYSDDARKRAMQRDAQRAENEAGRRERAAAKRRKDRNQLRKQGQFGASGKYYVTKNMEKESVEMKGSQFVEDMGEKEHEAETRKQIRGMFKAPSSSSAEAGDIARRRAKNKAALKRSEQGAARRKENRNYLRSVGKYKGPMEGVEMKPEDKTPENAGDITFDAGGAIPATIKAIGDPRELETAMKLKKTQLRASGLNMSHEPKGDTISDAYVVNQADKTSNTPAYQGYKAGKKNQITGEPLYKKGNMKENLVTIEKFNNVANINVKPSNYNSEKDVIKDILNKEVAQENYRAMRNPEKYKDPDESDKPYRERSKAARMRDPKRGINSPAFKEFMRKQGM